MENLSPYKVHSQEPPNLSHLRILGSTVYVLLHEEERLMKSEKWAPRALKGVLVGYDGHTIYRVYIKDQKKVIRVKGLRIFEDYETKTSTDLPDYDERPTFCKRHLNRSIKIQKIEGAAGLAKRAINLIVIAITNCC